MKERKKENGLRFKRGNSEATWFYLVLFSLFRERMRGWKKKWKKKQFASCFVQSRVNKKDRCGRVTIRCAVTDEAANFF